MAKVLGIDGAMAGMSGDMLLSGLLGLIESRDTLLEHYLGIFNEQCGCDISAKIISKEYKGFHGYYLDIEGTKDVLSTNKLREKLDQLLKNTVQEFYQEIGFKIINLIISIESFIHKESNVTLHELGTYDTLMDIGLSVYLLEYLNVSNLNLSALATGSGVVNTHHGKLPVPSPATLKILEDYSLISVKGPSGGEALTPTGAAIAAVLTKSFEPSTQVIWENNSLGFGTRSWDDRGNYLRVRLGGKVPTHSGISILETNLDDISGEYMGSAIALLMDAGALDVSYYPIIMKKNRPGYCLRVIIKTKDIDRMADEIMKHTGTLGVRVLNSERHIGSRLLSESSIIIEGKEYTYRIKSSKHRSKIEFEDLLRISKEAKLSLFELEKMLRDD